MYRNFTLNECERIRIIFDINTAVQVPVHFKVMFTLVFPSGNIMPCCFIPVE